MKTTIIKELTDIETGMKDINRPVFNKPENKKRNRELDIATLMLFKNLLILKEFVSNPVQSCTDITRIHSDLPYSKDFVELTKALNCSHTKEQGTVIGKGKIIEAIKKNITECVEKSKPLTEKVNESIAEIEKTIELVRSSFDSETAKRRYTQATENEYFTNYTKGFLDKVFVPAAIDISPTISPSKFVQTASLVYGARQKEQFATLVGILNGIILDTDEKYGYIEANNKYILTTQFNKTRFEYPEISGVPVKYGETKKEIYYKNTMKETFEKLPGGYEDKVDKLATFKTMVDNTEGLVDELVNNLEVVKGKYLELNSTSEKFDLPGFFKTIENEIVQPMESMTITLDDYSKKLDNYKIVVQNLLTLRNRIESYLEVLKPAPTNFYYTIDKLYKLIDKVLVKSTMSKGKEKEPQVIINDTTPPQGAGR